MILVLDFGSQYTQLIARKLRELSVYSEVVAYDISAQAILEKHAKGLILSGGPASIYEEDAPLLANGVLDLELPILGICYGMQLLVEASGGEVLACESKEYGRSSLQLEGESVLFHKLDDASTVWMSHGDSVTHLSSDFKCIAKSDTCPVVAIEHTKKPVFALQFHPEVAHTKQGTTILKNFLFDVCSCEANWGSDAFIEEAVSDIKKTVGEDDVICGLSGGVDSSVAAVLMQKAIGDQLTCIYIDTGFMRKGETESIKALFSEKYNINVCYVDASDVFFDVLKGIVDPEEKRKKIGETFVRVFEREAKKLSADGSKNFNYLAQGTLYPDIIESASVGVSKKAATIKTHHNVGGLPEEMDFKIIEPLKMLFKDEVRRVGDALGMPEETVYRHPFPGPGLAIRILGEVTRERVSLLQEADAIFIQEIKKAGLYRDIWQALAVLLPVKSVGVKGDKRSYEQTIALRAVESTDAMTATWYPMPYDVLDQMSSRILNEVSGVNRCVYDISSKPPSTIEWE